MSKKFYVRDCHDFIKELDENSIDLLYINPPFATTACYWDQSLRWDELFPEMFRVVKPNGNIVIHTSIPFTYTMIRHKKPNYHFTFQKGRPTGHLNAKREPLRDLEEILIYKVTPTAKYFPQMKGDTEHYSKRENPKGSKYNQKQKSYETTHKGSYPRIFLGKYPYISQKDSPKSIDDELTKYIIKTYTEEGDTILDFCCCNQNNGCIAEQLGRHYIGSDISDQYLGSYDLN